MGKKYDLGRLLLVLIGAGIGTMFFWQHAEGNVSANAAIAAMLIGGVVALAGLLIGMAREE